MRLLPGARWPVRAAKGRGGSCRRSSLLHTIATRHANDALAAACDAGWQGNGCSICTSNEACVAKTNNSEATCSSDVNWAPNSQARNGGRGAALGAGRGGRARRGRLASVLAGPAPAATGPRMSGRPAGPACA